MTIPRLKATQPIHPTQLSQITNIPLQWAIRNGDVEHYNGFSEITYRGCLCTMTRASISRYLGQIGAVKPNDKGWSYRRGDLCILASLECEQVTIWVTCSSLDLNPPDQPLPECPTVQSSGGVWA